MVSPCQYQFAFNLFVWNKQLIMEIEVEKKTTVLFIDII